MPRVWVWIQVLTGWLPVWALYTTLIFTAHQPVSATHAGIIAVRAILPAALLGVFVFRLTRYVPWPRPFRISFALVHLGAAIVYSIAWLITSSLVETVLHGRLVVTGGGIFMPFLVLGVWLYVMVAGISYAIAATDRAARAEAVAARTQLATLRAQLHPHFLFNALHTVVQLIPRQPARAAEAAEQVAGLLRTALEEERDLVSLDEEWAFVRQYLEVERLRFGDRLRVHTEIGGDARDALLPSFALQTLVENAVRHGAAPNVEATDITVTATVTPHALTLRVQDTGAGAPATPATNGTGLARLRERITVLYGGAAQLTVTDGAGRGFEAMLVIPRTTEAAE
jgi:two-component system, LytTR family, sensor kinase